MPGRAKLNFPSRRKRRELMMQLEEMGKDPRLAADENFKAYRESWIKLDRKMEDLSAEDENGVPKLLEDQDADELAAVIRETALAGENYIAAARIAVSLTGVEDPTIQTVDDFQALLGKDFTALKKYDPAVKKLSLAEIQENVRTQTIDLRGRQTGTLKNMSNERLPMTVVNAKGEKRPGVFTKAKYLDLTGKYRETLRKAKEACGDNEEAKQKLDSFLERYKLVHAGETTENNTKLQADSPDGFALGIFVSLTYDSINNLPYGPANLKTELASLSIPEVNKIPQEALRIFSKGLSELKDDITVEMAAYRLELEDGSRLDNRNTAMTAVADLFGFQDLIARSENMKFVDENGQVTEGTFMEYGKGYDLWGNRKLLNHVSNSPYGDLENKNRLFKQISDLQALDFICMNKDRHIGNLFYQVDKNGIITGIQGIDNDSAFGTASLLKADVKALKVITASTAQKIANMQPEMLKFVLRGRGLSKKEIGAACERLNQLKNGIARNLVKVVPDDQIGDLMMADCTVSGTRNNLFYQIDHDLTGAVKARNPYNDPIEPIPDPGTPELKEIETLSRRRTVYGLADSMGRVARLIRNDEGPKVFKVEDLTNIHGSSGYFKNMVNAARATTALRERIRQENAQEQGKLVMESGYFAEVDESFDTLRRTARAYLQYKLENTKQRPKPQTMEELVGKNDYERKRIQYARDILKTVDEYEKSKAPLTTDDEKEDMEANFQRRVLENRRAEAESHPAVPGLG